MKTRRSGANLGFSLTELVIAVALTLIVMSAVLGLLMRGQQSFQREPEVAAMHQSARAGLEKITRDLALGGYRTPGAAAILADDGGGNNPDRITILYADPDVPTCEAVRCKACGTLDESSTLDLNLNTMEPLPADPFTAYSRGMILFAVEQDDCNNDDLVGIYPLELTGAPALGDGDPPSLRINYRAHDSGAEFSSRDGFNGKVRPHCAVVGLFRAVQYRINPPPPAPRPTLERRDLALAEPWTPVSVDIENLQFHYATIETPTFVDAPPPPHGDDPRTWITTVVVTVVGRSESTTLAGGAPGVFSEADTHLRKSFSTSVSLRNVIAQAAALLQPRRFHIAW